MPLPNSLTRLATIVVALALALFYAPFALAKEAPPCPHPNARGFPARGVEGRKLQTHVQ